MPRTVLSAQSGAICCRFSVTAVAAAAVIAAGMSIGVAVVAATGVGIVAELASQQRCNSFVGITGGAGIQLNPRLRQCGTGAAADAAADQCIDLMLLQKACQGAVTGPLGVDELGAGHSLAIGFIKFEGFTMPKVLVDPAVFIGNCDFHIGASPYNVMLL